MKLRAYAFITVIACAILIFTMNYGNSKISEYSIAYAMGSAIGLIIFALIGGVLTYFISRRSNLATNIVIVILSVLGLGGQFSRKLIHSPKQEITEFVAAAEKELPIKIDEVTIFKAVKMEDNQLIYEYEFTKDADLDLSKESVEQFTATNRAEAQQKQKKIYDRIKRANMKWIFRYFQNGKLVLTFHIQ